MRALGSHGDFCNLAKKVMIRSVFSAPTYSYLAFVCIYILLHRFIKNTETVDLEKLDLFSLITYYDFHNTQKNPVYKWILACNIQSTS